MFKEERVKFLGQRSDKKYPIYLADQSYEDYWYKIRTAGGISGWVHGAGIKKDQNPLLNSSKQALARYTQSANFLHGRTLHYSIANDIYWRSHLEHPDVLSKEVEALISLSVDTSYLGILEEALLQAKERVAQAALAKQEVEVPDSIEINQDLVANEKPQVPKRKKKPKKKRRKETVRTTPVVPIPEDLAVHNASVPADQTNSAKPSTSGDDPIRTISLLPTSYVDIAAEPDLSQQRKVLLRGTTSRPMSRKLKVVLIEDPISFNEKELNGRFQAQSFEREAFLLANTVGYIQYGNQKLDIFLRPGDQITVDFDPDDFPGSVQYSGDAARENNYLVARQNIFQQELKDLQRMVRDAEPGVFRSFMDQSRQSLLNFLDQYHQRMELPLYFYEFARAEIDYWFAYQLLNYPWEHPLYHNQDPPMKVGDAYYDFFDLIPISNNYALPHANYTYFLDQFFDYQRTQVENQYKSEADLARYYLKGEALYYYLAKYYALQCKRGKALLNGFNIQAFIEDCPRPLYGNLLRQVYNESRGLAVGDLAPNFTLRDVNGKEVLLSDFRGKVVYLDFWATWCSPCIMAMRHSKQWKSRFSSREVVFLYVSIDEDVNAWKNFVRSQGPRGVHIKADDQNGFRSKIAKLYKVKKLPAVFVVDQQGKVYFNSVEEGGTGKAQDKIGELLY